MTDDAAQLALGPRPPDPRTVPVNIPTPGARVTAKGTKHLKAACFLARHLSLTQRPLAHETFTTDRVTQWEHYLADSSKYEEPDEMITLKNSDASTIIEFIEDFEQALFNYEGAAGSLNYVIRDGDPPNASTDPLFGEVGSQDTSLRHEIAARAAFTQADNRHFATDNARVFDLLSKAVSSHKQVVAWIKGHRFTKDGQAAWTGFKAHYLGTSQMDGIANRAEARIEKSVYSSELPRYNFERHVTLHHKAHHNISQATGNTLMNRDKIHRFLLTIKAPFLQVPIATVKATPQLRTNWEECTNYLREFIPVGTRGTKVGIAAIGAWDALTDEQSGEDTNKRKVTPDKKSKK